MRHLRDPRTKPLDDARAWVRALEDDPEPDMYGVGEILNDFEREVAAHFEKRAAVFLPSGIMAQQIALRIHAERTGRTSIGYHPRAHLEDKEARALEVVHGLRTVTVGHRTRLITLADLEGCRERLGALLLELPQRELGGELPSWDDLCAQLSWCRTRGTATHLDGARVWEACPRYAQDGKSPADVVRGFDTVYVSFYKGLNGVCGAMLLGDEDVIDEARIWQRRLGGNLIHMWPLVVSARAGFRERVPKMTAFCEAAVRVGARFSAIPGVVVRPEKIETNMFHMFIPRDPDDVTAAGTQGDFRLFSRAVPAEIPGWSKIEIGCGEHALNLDDDVLDAAIAGLRKDLSL